MSFAKLPPEVLRAATQAALKAAKKELRRGVYVKSPQRMLDSLRASYINDRIVISTDHPAFEYLSKGVRRHVMRYLENASAPIPFLTATGQVEYRKASSKSLDNGSWVHPGFMGRNFTEKMQGEASKAAAEVVGDYYTQQYLKTVQTRLQKVLKKRR